MPLEKHEVWPTEPVFQTPHPSNSYQLEGPPSPRVAVDRRPVTKRRMPCSLDVIGVQAFRVLSWAPVPPPPPPHCTLGAGGGGLRTVHLKVV